MAAIDSCFILIATHQHGIAPLGKRSHLWSPTRPKWLPLPGWYISHNPELVGWVSFLILLLITLTWPGFESPPYVSWVCRWLCCLLRQVFTHWYSGYLLPSKSQIPIWPGKFLQLVGDTCTYFSQWETPSLNSPLMWWKTHKGQGNTQHFVILPMERETELNQFSSS